MCPSSPFPSLSTPLSLVFLLLQTSSSSAVALSSSGLPPGSAPSSHHSLSPPPPAGSSGGLPPPRKPSPQGHSHTLGVLCAKDNVAPGQLDLAGFGVMPDTPNSRFPSTEGWPGLLSVESQAHVWRDPPDLVEELCRVPPGHILPYPGGTGPQDPGAPQAPLANALHPEEAVAATWQGPWALGVLKPEPPQGAAPNFQEVTEPAVVAVDRQAVFPDTWSLTEERGCQERARPEPGAPESGRHTPVEDEQLGGETPLAGGLVRPARGPETPRRPEGTTEVTTEARMDRPELPRAVAVDMPSTTERISTSSQAGAHSPSCSAWPRLAGCMQPPCLRMSAWAAGYKRLRPETPTASAGQWALWGQRSSVAPGIS